MNKKAYVLVLDLCTQLENIDMSFFDNKPLFCQSVINIVNSKYFDISDVTIVTNNEDYIEHIKIIYPEIKILYIGTIDCKMGINEITNCILTKEVLDDCLFGIFPASSPMRSTSTIEKAIDMFLNSEATTLVSVHNFLINRNESIKDIRTKDKDYFLFDNANELVPNSSIFLSNTNKYKGSFFTINTIFFPMNKIESIFINDYCDFYNAVGHKVFDYDLREKNNFTKSKTEYINKIKSSSKEQDIVLIGDSRTIKIADKRILNLSVPGLTAKNCLAILKEIHIPYNLKVVIGIGINEINTSRNLIEIFKLFSELLTIFKNHEVYVMEVMPTIYRPGFSNDLIKQLNDKLKGLCRTFGFEFLIFDTKFVDNDRLNFDVTYDGLHLNDDTIVRLKNIILNVVKL